MINSDTKATPSPLTGYRVLQPLQAGLPPVIAMATAEGETYFATTPEELRKVALYLFAASKVVSHDGVSAGTRH